MPFPRKWPFGSGLPAEQCRIPCPVSIITPDTHCQLHQKKISNAKSIAPKIPSILNMFLLPRNFLEKIYAYKIPIHNFLHLITAQIHSDLESLSHSSVAPVWFHDPQPVNTIMSINLRPCYYSTRSYRGPISRSLRRRINKRAKDAAKPTLNEAVFHQAISRLPHRFTPEELHDVIVLQDDPLVCLELFNWASHQHRFRHNVCTYHVTIKKLGAAKWYEEMDNVVNQVLSMPSIGSEALYNTMIYYFTEARKLVRAVNIYNLMRNSRKLDCRPSLRTYNILFTALLSRGKNSYINHLYMETIRSLFKKMVDDGVEPDIFCLNCMIKGYVLSLHVNDALRIFHQMGVVYDYQPNSFSYNYLIYGLCAQGRTNNARELCEKMKKSGFVPNSKSYNSLVNSLALQGELDGAVEFLWEMAESQRLPDFITYQTVLDEMSRQKSVRDAMRLLEKLQEKELVNGQTYRELFERVAHGM